MECKDEITASRGFGWKFSNFKRESFEKLENQKYIFTDEFYIFLGDMETKWKLGAEIAKSTFGIYIYLLEAESKDFHVVFEIFVQAEKGEKKFLRSFTKSAKELTIQGWGWKGYLEIEDIFNKFNNILRDDALVLKIKIELTKLKDVPEQNCNKCEIELQNITSKYEELHNSKELSDFKFICSDGKEIPAHIVILAANSPVMRTMLNTPMLESKNHEVKINDIDGDTMLEILRYIYSREVKDIDILAPKLLYGAEKYQLNELKERCIKSMIANLTIENSVDYFILADRHSVKKLLGNCMRFIVLNYMKIRQNDCWEKMDSKLLSTLMDYIHSTNYGQEFEATLFSTLNQSIEER